jgi:spermidine synthase
LDSSELAFDYTKYYKLYKFLTPQLNRALVLGAGAYTIPRVLRQNEPEAHIDVVDIEPGLEALSEEFFGFVPDPHIQTHVTDGRRFLQEADTPYDFIFSDVYYSLSIPTHMATREFFTLASKQLSPEGVFVANIIGRMDADTPSLLPSLMRTFEESFPATAYFAVDSPESPALQNFIFVGHTGGEPIDACSAAFQDHTDPFLRTLCPHQMDPSTMNLAAHPLITDDYAPLEYLTSRALAVVTPLTAK